MTAHAMTSIRLWRPTVTWGDRAVTLDGEQMGDRLVVTLSYANIASVLFEASPYAQTTIRCAGGEYVVTFASATVVEDLGVHECAAFAADLSKRCTAKPVADAQAGDDLAALERLFARLPAGAHIVGADRPEGFPRGRVLYTEPNKVSPWFDWL